MQIYLRKAKLSDSSATMVIINQAKSFLRSYGSPQWQDGHPNLQMVKNDIEHQYSWVLIVNGKIMGTVALTPGPDPHYEKITAGQWANPSEPYAIIHRVAISNTIRGQHLGKFLFATLISVGLSQGIHNFRYDTHAMNIPMQELGRTMGFVQRGTIYVNDQIDTKRIGFELNL